VGLEHWWRMRLAAHLPLIVLLQNFTKWGGEEPNVKKNDPGNEIRNIACICPGSKWCAYEKGVPTGYDRNYFQCVCQSYDRTSSGPVTLERKECSDVAGTGYALGIVGWCCYLLTLYVLRACYFRRYGKDIKAFILVVSLVLQPLQIAGVALLVDKCHCEGVERSMGITFLVFGCLGFLPILMAIGIYVDKEPDAVPVPPAPPVAPLPASEVIVGDEVGPAVGMVHVVAAKSNVVAATPHVVQAKPVAVTGMGASASVFFSAGLTLSEQLGQIEDAQKFGQMTQEEAALARQGVLARFTS